MDSLITVTLTAEQAATVLQALECLSTQHNTAAAAHRLAGNAARAARSEAVIRDSLAAQAAVDRATRAARGF